MNFYIDLILVYSYNIRMKKVSQCDAGFFRADRDTSSIAEKTLNQTQFFNAFILLTSYSYS